MLSITGQKSNASNFFKALAKEIPSGEPDLGKIISVANHNGVTFQAE